MNLELPSLEDSQPVAIPVAEVAEVAEVADPAPKRNALTMQERLDVIDFIRGSQNLIAAETKAEAARIVSSEAGVEITASMLDYLITSLPKLELSKKFVIGNTPPEVNELRSLVAALEARIVALEAAVNF